MVDPDFATAGQFEGERKHQKKKKKYSRSSSGSKSGWKTFFRMSKSNDGGVKIAEGSEEPLTTKIVTGAANASSPAETLEPVGPTSTDMITTSGKDVLWFKGEGKKVPGIPS